MNPKAIVLYLHVHQPYRIRPYSVFDIANNSNYFDSNSDQPSSSELIIKKVAAKSYLPTNKLLKELIEQNPGFKLNISITGVVLEQMKQYYPEVLESFQELIGTGKVEILAETYHHSLAFFYSRPEFEAQVKMHQDSINHYFGVKPVVFRNTELTYNNDLAYWADQAGYKGIITEGWDPILGWKSPNYVYRPSYTQNIKLLLKNYHLSDDLAFRFGDSNW